MSRINSQKTRQKQPQSWVDSRRILTRTLRAQAERLGGLGDSNLRRYSREFEQDWRRTWRASTKSALVEAADQSDIILMSDFHGFHQSQRSHLRWLQALPPTSRQRVMFLECFETVHDPLLKRFSRGALAEKDLLKKTKWESRWTFPWSFYRPVVQWALRHGVELRGWSDWSTSKSLEQRDARMAQILLDCRVAHPESQVFAWVGEWHLCPSHLLALLPPSLCVLQDLEHVYFRLLKKDPLQLPDVVRSGPRFFCVMASAPWVKWQSYLLHLESSFDRMLGDGFDGTDHVRRLLHLAQEDLQVRVSEGRLHVDTAETLSTKQWKDKELRQRAQEERSFFRPSDRFAYLATPTVNHAAYLAGSYLHAEACDLNSDLNRPEDWLRWCWHQAAVFVVCKLINPRRVATTLADVRKEVGKDPAMERVLRLALSQRLLEIGHSRSLSRPPKVVLPTSSSARERAGQIVGFMLGERVFLAFRRGRVSLDELQELFRKDVFASDFERFYYQICQRVEPLAQLAKERAERL